MTKNYIKKLRLFLFMRIQKGPNFFEDVFPKGKVPRIFLSNENTPLNRPEKIWITCTTFRDGQQARPPYTVEQIVNLYDILHRLDNNTGVIRQSEFFLYSDKDREAIRACQEKGYEFPEITGWIRAVASDFKHVKEVGLKETGILTSCSDYHIFLKLKSPL